MNEHFKGGGGEMCIPELPFLNEHLRVYSNCSLSHLLPDPISIVYSVALFNIQYISNLHLTLATYICFLQPVAGWRSLTK
jgi:hypothetical protein